MRTILPKKQLRQSKILTELQIFPQMTVHDLAGRLGVSQETIRRDLAQLDREGKVSRMFGGAVGMSTSVPGIEERKSIMVAERDKMSKVAMAMLEPNDVVMVGGGSTTIRLALALMNLNFPITVVTHSLPFATIVSKNKKIEVEMLPGRLIADEGLTIGTNTLRSISRLSAHKAIVGASGINSKGLYALLESGEVYGAMVECADQALLLIDSTKFGVTALSQYGSWQAKSTLITDKLPGDDILSALKSANAQIVVA